MTLIRIAALLALMAQHSPAQNTPDSFDLKVERVRVLRNQPGDLHIDSKGVTFRSRDGKTNITVPIEDLREADVADPRTMRFQAFEVQKWKPIERREYVFRATEEAPVEALAPFLAARVYRPVVGHYASASQFQIPAFHRRARGGTHGTLDIGDEAIRFVSDKPADSRTWLYRDIETIGRPDSYRFRVTTNRETYVVELKASLPEDAYEFAWSKVYNLDKTQSNSKRENPR
jgi:hypothetical protein